MDAVFIHRGASDYLPYVLRQAVESGMPVTLIGDEAAHGQAPPEVECVAIGQYYPAMEPMTAVYRHMSVTPYPEYERFCFERWFIFREHLRATGRPGMMLDSDVLIYPGLVALVTEFARGGAFLLDTPWCQPVWDALKLDFVCQNFIALFGDEAAIAEVSGIANLGQIHVSDMFALYRLQALHPDKIANIRNKGRARGLCTNINNRFGFDAVHNYRAPSGWDGGRPVFRRTDGVMVPFVLLHCQGRSKAIIDHFCAFDTAGLPDLKVWFRNERSKAHPQYADAIAFDTWLRENFRRAT